jgi:hypothetical protein
VQQECNDVCRLVKERHENDIIPVQRETDVAQLAGFH